MPTYEYACTKCGHKLEVFQSMKAEPLRKCPECGRLALKRMIGPGSGVIFKGAGFYVNDYKKHGSGNKTRSSHKAKSPDAASKPEGKPAAATSTTTQ
ncbi:MAG: zinc ribbon domain-containing protein [Opitutaceae bacterium]|nr:zinc ribbon domain-containing protein [Opitutaceae bacterium]